MAREMEQEPTDQCKQSNIRGTAFPSMGQILSYVSLLLCSIYYWNLHVGSIIISSLFAYSCYPDGELFAGPIESDKTTCQL